MDNICKNYEKCPIYNETLKEMPSTASYYKKHFCEAGDEGCKKCKRYLVKDKSGKCPERLLPNDPREVDTIIKEHNL